MNLDISLSDIIIASNLHPSRIFNVYVFGSRVYGTYDDKSDYDIIIIANNSIDSTEIRNGIYNIHIYTLDKFKEDLNWHRIQNIECIYSDSKYILKEDIKFNDFKIDFNKLRHSISHVSSNSWVKCKKKLTVANEYKIGIKSLFHSIRIPLFAIQIVKYGKIVDYSEGNYIWDDIKYSNLNWEQLNDKYKTHRNNILTNFRALAKKEKTV